MIVTIASGSGVRLPLLLVAKLADEISELR
jgi:hypothetical protein